MMMIMMMVVSVVMSMMMMIIMMMMMMMMVSVMMMMVVSCRGVYIPYKAFLGTKVSQNRSPNPLTLHHTINRDEAHISTVLSVCEWSTWEAAVSPLHHGTPSSSCSDRGVQMCNIPQIVK